MGEFFVIAVVLGVVLAFVAVNRQSIAIGAVACSLVCLAVLVFVVDTLDGLWLTRSDVVGQYGGQAVGETLDLRANGTFIQRVREDTGTWAESSGRWDFGSGAVVLHDFKPGPALIETFSAKRDWTFSVEEDSGLMRLRVSGETGKFYLQGARY